MRILILGNMANDGYAVAKELRKMNYDVDLAINSSDFGMALPEWEDADMAGVDPYAVDVNKIKSVWKPPAWIRYFDFKNKVSAKNDPIGKIKARMDLLKMIGEYDIVEPHVPFAIYSQFTRVPYVVYDAGWIRYFPYQKGIRSWLAKRGYRKARSIIITNPDTFEISDSLHYLKQDRIFFCPFAIDPEKYRPINVAGLRSTMAKESELLLFCPARQIWAEKGNEKMIQAFANFVKEFPEAVFVMVAWSIDEDRSKDLVRSLGIEGKVRWIKPVPKNHLIQYYNASDIVLDQFVLGSWGTSTPEAMACGKPVLMYYKSNFINRAFGELPPILNSFSVEEIKNNLVQLARNIDLRLDIGKKSREWVIKTHSSRVVALRHVALLESAI